MFDLTKAQAMAVGVMLGLGVAAPILSWQLSGPRERLDAARATGFDAAALRLAAPPLAIPEPLKMDELVVGPHQQMLAETVIKARAPEAATEPAAEPPPERRCYYHQSETLATGAVLICDVDRSDSGQRGSVFAPQKKPTQLAPHDAPSPTGLIEGR